MNYDDTNTDNDSNETWIDDNMNMIESKLFNKLKIVSSSFQAEHDGQSPNQAGFTETMTVDFSGLDDFDSSRETYNDEETNEAESISSDVVISTVSAEAAAAAAAAYKELDTIACKIRSFDSSNNTSPWSPLLSIKLSREVRFASGIKHYQANGGNGGVVANASRDSSLEQALKSVEAKESLYSRFFIGFLGILSFDFFKLQFKDR